MYHKAYLVDWHLFTIELRSLISNLSPDSKVDLLNFIKLNQTKITDPYEGEPLSESWVTELSELSVDELADYSLALCYSVTEEHGLGDHWLKFQESLPEDQRKHLLGSSFTAFDPGKMGSYFQSPKEVEDSLIFLKPYQEELNGFYDLLTQCTKSAKGLYVTF